MVRELVVKALKKASEIEEVHLEIPENEEFGDYATNVALQIKDLKTEKPHFAKATRGKPKNIRQMAEEIVAQLKEDKELSKIVEKIEVAGPGFVNFWLSREALLENLREIVGKGEKYGSSNIGKGKTVVIDYSAPNIAKRFGIGHLRSTVIGQVLYNLYKFLGCKVIGDNHLGDWGTQFGALLAQIRSTKFEIRNLTIDDLEEMYVEFHKKAEENPVLWDEARAWFKKLEEGNEEARRIWKEIVEISMTEFNRIYELLGVKIDYAYGESFYENKMPDVVEELKNKGLLVESQGALIVEFKDLSPAMVTKSDGATTYFTRDLATVAFRIGTWNPDLFIYEVGADQTLHFRQVFAAAKLLGWEKGREFVHVPHGLIRFENGKMSTRRGQTIKLEEVLNVAIKRAKQIIEKSETPRLRASTGQFGPELTAEGLSRMSSGQASRGLSKKEIGEVARAVGIGAVKYFDLMHHPTTDIIFDWEKMFVLEGNSAPYLQYTYARCQSVLKRAKFPISNSQFPINSNKSNSQIRKLKINWRPETGDWKFNPEELSVLRTLVHFPEVVVSSAKSYSPNLLANYLFGLAQKFNAFYNKYRILPPEKEIGNWKTSSASRVEIGNFRLPLTAGVGQILKSGLTLLGISTPARM